MWWGTIRKNQKGNPKEIRFAKLKKGKVVHANKRNIHILKRKDKRDVHMVFTKHNLDFTSVTNKFGQTNYSFGLEQ